MSETGVLTRELAVATLEQGDAALHALFAQLSPDQMVQTGTIGAGDWSAKDLLGHIAFWEELAVQTLTAWRAGQPPATESLFGDAATDAANARNQERTTRQSLAEVYRRAEAAHRTVLESIRALSDQEWHAIPAYPDANETTLADLLGGVLAAPSGPFQHAFAHVADLRTYVASLSQASG